jgi:hypothetical protein
MCLGILLSFISIGCDKVCKKTVEDVATIQNHTGRPLSLFLCKGRAYGETMVTISRESSAYELNLGAREASEVKGGPGQSCDGVRGEKTNMGVSLSPKSFDQVKLCYDDKSLSNLFIEIFQNCPTGMLEQTSAEPCN